MLKPIPFDNQVVAAVVSELAEFEGGRVQEARQPDANEIALEIHRNSVGTAWLVGSWSPKWFRLHLSKARPRTMPKATSWLTAIRARLIGGRIVAIRQLEGDRIVEILISTESGDYRLLFELTGPHSNAILMDGKGRVIESGRRDRKSVRPVEPGVQYRLPPSSDRKESRFYESLSACGPQTPGSFLSPGFGAYPFSPAPLGYTVLEKATLSAALDAHFRQAILADEEDRVRVRLKTQAQRVANARTKALQELEQVASQAAKVATWQETGDLILAYQYAWDGGTDLPVYDSDGELRNLPMDPNLTAVENADKHFKRAKQVAKRAGYVEDQRTRLTADLLDLSRFLADLDLARSIEDLRRLEQDAEDRRWLFQSKPNEPGAPKPFDGHRIRELLGPNGITILYGENATANDYLTSRVSKPKDIWLHVRGATSAHVIIRTEGRPDRIQREQLEFAAIIAARNSALKHSQTVPVDYTERRYVRKPKGAPVGTAQYTNEKTLHVDPGL